jgi:hypothetical protein
VGDSLNRELLAMSDRASGVDVVHKSTNFRAVQAKSKSNEQSDYTTEKYSLEGSDFDFLINLRIINLYEFKDSL